MKPKERNGGRDAGSEDKLTCAKPLQAEGVCRGLLQTATKDLGQSLEILQN